MTARKALGGALLAFVVAGVGVGVAREVRRRGGPAASAPAEEAPRDGVVVYFMHPAARCDTCRKIERMATDLVDRRFAAARAAGRLVWRDVNYHEQPDLAGRYQVVSSSVVLVRRAAGAEVEHQRLEEVWTLHDDPAAFDAYVAGALDRYLAEPSP